MPRRPNLAAEEMGVIRLRGWVDQYGDEKYG